MPSEADQSSSSSSPSSDAIADYIPSKPQEQQLWHEFGNPEKPVNLIPTSTAHDQRRTDQQQQQQQQQQQDPSSPSPTGSLSLEGLKNVHKTPCARDSLLVGIAGGLGVGSIKALVGGIRRQGVWPACNFAVGGFAVLSLATYELCQFQRRREIEGMKEANELMKQLRAKKEKEKEAAKAADEQEQWQKSWRNPAKYKFW